jgi:hypothetical protein
MRWGWVGILAAVGCSSANGDATGVGGAASASSGAHTPSSSATSTSSTSSTTSTATMGVAATSSSSGAGGAPFVDALGDNRDRLLGTYYDYLEQYATVPQSNGLSAASVASVCDVWAELDPSSRAVFLTLSARLQRSTLAVDGHSMLWHVTRLVRLVGGQGATATDPGSCGGGEQNRVILSMDDTLHASLVAASANQGAMVGGKYDIAEAPPQGTFWRDSHDLGGTHAPFDLSDETDEGAPRGQVQYFADPSSALAHAPLGRLDLETWIDPHALEMDQDYDCPHDSNPLCTYVTWGQLCFPQAATLGVDLFAMRYGDYEPGYVPAGCP